MATKEHSIIQENLCKLYLRLNGYLCTGFILHSELENRQKGEVDIIGVRFPFHRQDETEHNSSPYLEVPNNIDIIIGEVKSNGIPLKFNKNLSTANDCDGWDKIVKWLGIIEPHLTTAIAAQLNALVVPVQNDKRTTLLSHRVTTTFGEVSLRPILFSPEQINTHHSAKFIHWSELNDFIWECLCPVPGTRNLCGTRYDFDSWGQELIGLVAAYKRRQKTQIRFNNIAELYAEMTAKK